jgi:hypothetical protein
MIWYYQANVGKKFALLWFFFEKGTSFGGGGDKSWRLFAILRYLPLVMLATNTKEKTKIFFIKKYLKNIKYYILF